MGILLYAGRIAPQPHWRMEAHRHPHHDEVIAVVAGELHARVGGQTLVARPGEILHYPAGALHVEAASGEAALETLFVGFRAPARLDMPFHNRDRDGHVIHALRWILALKASGSPADAAVAESLFRAVLHELANALNVEGSDNELVRRVQRFVEFHLASRLTLRDLAHEAGLSVFHFSRVFAKATGQTPMAYVRGARLRKAMTLLQTTSLPLRAIAPLAGFADAMQFSRVFRRQTGKAPGAYRKELE